MSKGEKGFPGKKGPTRKSSKRDGTSRFVNEKTRAMRSKSAPRDKNILRNLAANDAGGALSQSQLEAAAELSKEHKPKRCMTCKRSGCNQSKCLLLHTFFRGVVNRKDLVFDQQEYVVCKFGKHHNKQPFNGPHYNIDDYPTEFHADVTQTGSSSLDFELGVTKQSASKTNSAKSNNHYLDDVKKYLEKSPHLMCFKTEHTKPINSILSEFQRRILKKLDSNFDHHEKLILSSKFKPQKYPTGTPVRKWFAKKGWFDGKVVEFWSNRNGRCYKIKCEDSNNDDVCESDMDELMLEYEKAHQRDYSTSSDDGNDDASECASSSATPVRSNTGQINASNQSNQNPTSSDDSSDSSDADVVLAELGEQKSQINDKAMKLTANVRLGNEANCAISIGARSGNHGKRQLVDDKPNGEKGNTNNSSNTSETSKRQRKLPVDLRLMGTSTTSIRSLENSNCTTSKNQSPLVSWKKLCSVFPFAANTQSSRRQVRGHALHCDVTKPSTNAMRLIYSDWSTTC